MKLFSPLKIGDLEIKNRIIMAPLTRSRATGEDGRTPNDLMEKYYLQRSTAGLIISEATSITPMGVGYKNTPGIWSEEQIEGWKKITTALHAKGGKIFLQLWHVGRVSHPSLLNGELPVAPSAIAPKGHVSLIHPRVEYVTPRALEVSEIPYIVEKYRQGAENAKKAGFDGVEIHAANGYLIDQFLQDSSNKRTDIYGGNIENRSRFLLDITDAVISVWGANRVGVHLAPRGDSHSMGDSDPAALFRYVGEQLNQRKIAFIFTREYKASDSITPEIRKVFKGILIGNEKYTKDLAEDALQKDEVDAVSFGKAFIANPDLVKRFAENKPLNTPKLETFYLGEENGYTDYPMCEEN